MAESTFPSVFFKFYSRNRNRIGRLIRWIFFLLSCAFIYWHFREEKYIWSYPPMWSNIRSSWMWIACVLLLAPFNWLIESEKFRMLIRLIYPLDVFTSFRAYLTGTSVSLFTPNRSGEFAGKILYLPGKHRAPGALLAMVGSTAQLLVTIQAGLIAAIFVFEYNNPLLTVLVFIAVFVLLAAWSWLPSLMSLLHRLPMKSAWKESLHRLRDIPFRIRITVWGLSVFRYAVFCTQQLILFDAFGAAPEITTYIPLMAIAYVYMSQVPSFGLGELVVRNMTSLQAFSMIDVDPFIVLMTTTTLWTINVGLPALLGGLSLLKLKRTETAS